VQSQIAYHIMRCYALNKKFGCTGEGKLPLMSHITLVVLFTRPSSDSRHVTAPYKLTCYY